MNRHYFAFFAAAACVCGATTIPEIRTKPGDMSQPVPVVVAPGEAGSAPSDAVVLFDGKDLSAWQPKAGGPMRWTLGRGYFSAGPGAGEIVTRQSFGDCQLHIEWATPAPPRRSGQDRGNSGVYLMSLYELQILDSFRNPTYPDGQAGAIYCQYPPLVNASRPPGMWQSYDVVFHGPRFSPAGELLRPATITVLHSGVLVQDHAVLTGPSTYMKRPPYQPHPRRMPLMLQDHDQPVRFRNIWIRELKDVE